MKTKKKQEPEPSNEMLVVSKGGQKKNREIGVVCIHLEASGRLLDSLGRAPESRRGRLSSTFRAFQSIVRVALFGYRERAECRLEAGRPPRLSLSAARAAQSVGPGCSVSTRPFAFIGPRK